MSIGFGVVFRSLCKALVVKGSKVILQAIPFGGVIEGVAEVAGYTWDEIKKAGAEPNLRKDLEGMPQASPDQVRQAAAEAVRQVASDQPAEVQQNLATSLEQVPSTSRRTMERPGAPPGRTVPATLVL